MINKFHSVKEGRRDAWENLESRVKTSPVLGDLMGDLLESENEVPLSEEEDHDALQPDSDISVSTHPSCSLGLIPQLS